MTELDTPRLHLHPLRAGDYADFAAYVQDDALCRLYGLPSGMDAGTIRQVFSHFLRGGKAYAIVLRGTGRMIGHLLAVPSELPAPPPEMRGVTLAFAIAHAWQRQGLMTELLQAVCNHLLRGARIGYIHCGCFDFNEGSLRLQQKLGFRQVGTHTLGTRTVIDSVLFPPEKH